MYGAGRVNSFQPSNAFHIEISHLICHANQMTGFYMKCNTCLKWVDALTLPATILDKNKKINLNIYFHTSL